MKKQFPYFYLDSECSVEPLWQDALIAFDANVLLNLYAFNAKSRKEWVDAFKLLLQEKRLFMPYQVAYEYHLGLAGRLYNVRKHSSRTDALSKEKLLSAEKLSERFPLIKSPDVVAGLDKVVAETQVKINHALDEGLKNYNSALRKYAETFESDWKQFRDDIAEVFASCINEKPDQHVLHTRCCEAEDRYQQNVPPGYKDRAKKHRDFGNQYGDALIWFELKDQAIRTKQHVVFVTFDHKSDWFQDDDGTIITRRELVNEMLVDSGVLFQLATANKFADWMQTAIGAKESVAEVRRVQEVEEALKSFAFYCTDDDVLSIWQSLSDTDRNLVTAELARQAASGHFRPLVVYNIQVGPYRIELEIDGNLIVIRQIKKLPLRERVVERLAKEHPDLPP